MVSNQLSAVNPTADWRPRSAASVPALIPPHPPLLSGGWYRGLPTEAPGPGRAALSKPVPRSAGLAFVLGVLFGPLGLCYVSTSVGLVATALTAAALVVAGGFVPLLVIWPLAVLGSVWGAGHVRVSG